MSKLPLTEPEISRFAEQLGRMLLRLPVVSGVAGHKRAQYTVQDYLRIEASAESEFLVDVFTKPISEVLLKWYPYVKGEDGVYLFSWPDVNVSGGPSREEMVEAMKVLTKGLE